MEEKMQQEFRDVLHKEYMKLGFEGLVLFAYFGKRYAKIETTMKEYEGRVIEANKNLGELTQNPPADLSKEALKLAKEGLRKDIQTYTKLLDAARKPAQNLYQKGAQWREKAIENMEIADEVKSFKVKTPEEIAADKKANQGTTPAVIESKDENTNA